MYWYSVNLFKQGSSIITWLILKLRIGHYTARIPMISGRPEMFLIFCFMYASFGFCRKLGILRSVSGEYKGRN